MKHTEVESCFVIGRNLRFEILIIERRRYDGRSGEIARAIIGRCLVRVCVVADLCQRTSHFQQTDLFRQREPLVHHCTDADRRIEERTVTFRQGRRPVIAPGDIEKKFILIREIGREIKTVQRFLFDNRLHVRVGNTVCQFVYSRRNQSYHRGSQHIVALLHHVSTCRSVDTQSVGE